MITHVTYVGDGDGGNGQKILLMANMMVMAQAELGFQVQMVEQRGGDGDDSHEDGDDCDWGRMIKWPINVVEIKMAQDELIICISLADAAILWKHAKMT